jgi:DNA-binding ferritin-like protein (Dps family)
MYTVQAGRVICKNGKPLFSISREVNTATGEAEFTPVQADAIAHFIAQTLTDHDKTWVNFYLDYMKK